MQSRAVQSKYEDLHTWPEVDDRHKMILRTSFDGLQVSRLGLGCGPLGEVTQSEADDIVRSAVELGINLFDTAPSYGDSELRLGQAVHGVRDRVLLSTKLGYGIAGVEDWTGECIRQGIDTALQRLDTDVLDIAFLHSCPVGTLQRDDVLRAVEEGVRSGKVRYAGYSGDGDALRFARRLRTFHIFQVSHNLVDCEASREGFPPGTIAFGKRTLLNAAFRESTASDDRSDVREYRRRWQALSADLPQLATEDPVELALRFAAHTPSIACSLVGTRRVSHLTQAASWIAKGPLPSEVQEAILQVNQRFAWPGMI